MHERRFNSEIDKLRSPERIARLEPEKVIKLALEDLNGIKTILDVGTGSGIFAEQFGKLGYKVNGLDANPDMLPIASKYVPEGIFNKGIAEKLPFQDGQFDLVFMGLLLHETDDANKAINEAYRVAAKRLAILEWPYEEGSFGPPLGDRLSADRILDMSLKAGFNSKQSFK